MCLMWPQFACFSFQFELEIQRVHESYESLVKSSQKRERLEGALKMRMEEEIKKLKAENRQLKGKCLALQSVFGSGFHIII